MSELDRVDRNAILGYDSDAKPITVEDFFARERYLLDTIADLTAECDLLREQVDAVDAARVKAIARFAALTVRQRKEREEG